LLFGVLICCCNLGLLLPVKLAAQTAVLTLGWDANFESDLAGYRIYFGVASRLYNHILDVGNLTEYTIQGLDSNQCYYLSVTAYDQSGNESDYSLEVSGVPSSSTTTEPRVFILFQNYPNPFNPVTTIPYFLFEETAVVVQIISSSGQTVRELVNQQQAAGMHYTTWNGKDSQGTAVASGVYFSLLETKNFHLSRPLVLAH